MAILCFCPPDKVTPRSPTSVSYPSGKLIMASSMHAICAAYRISSMEASGTEADIFSRIVLEYKKGSCKTVPIFLRSSSMGISLISLPPIQILPLLSLSSYSLERSCTTVDFPLPVPPKTPNVLPSGIVNEMSLSTSFPSSYPKDTC